MPPQQPEERLLDLPTPFQQFNDPETLDDEVVAEVTPVAGHCARQACVHLVQRWRQSTDNLVSLEDFRDLLLMNRWIDIRLHLAAMERLKQALDAEQVILIAQALELGMSWQQIGQAVGKAKQTVHRKFSARVAAFTRFQDTEGLFYARPGSGRTVEDDAIEDIAIYMDDWYEGIL